jgi:putative transposase
MARQPRLYAAGYAQLISIQFSEAVQQPGQSLLDQRYQNMTTWLGEATPLCHASIHGWSITPRALLLLATPTDDKSLPSLVQALGRKLAAQLKLGGVFSGRYHATIPQPSLWVLPALIWLEQQPVREKLVEDAESWPWSSARVHTGAVSQAISWLQPHPDYWLCGNTPFDRQANYRKRLYEGLPSGANKRISFCLNGQWALGDEPFIGELQKIATRRVSPGNRGRPKKN